MFGQKVHSFFVYELIFKREYFLRKINLSRFQKLD